MEYALAEIAINKWWIAAYGWATYNLIIWFVEKEKADKLKERFDYMVFVRTHVDNWIVSFIIGLPTLFIGPEIHEFIMRFVPESFRFGWSDFFYAGAAANIEVLYWFITEGIPVLKKRALRMLDKGAKETVAPDPVQPPQQGSDETPA